MQTSGLIKEFGFLRGMAKITVDKEVISVDLYF